jgi:DNA polymerase-3 subunit beta
MDFSVKREALSGALQALVGVVAARPTSAILGNVLLVAESGSLALGATDLDMWGRCSISATVQNDGRATLPIRKLAAIIRSLPDDVVSLGAASSGNAVRINGANSRFRLSSLPVEDFPEYPPFGEASHLELPASELISMLRLVDYAQSPDEHRHTLQGVYFQIEREKMVLVATDGRRLAVVERPNGHLETNFILPARAVRELMGFLVGGATVILRQDAHLVSFAINRPESPGAPRSLNLVSKIIEGNYPNYRQVIPGGGGRRVPLPRVAFLGALQRAALVCSGLAPSVQLRFSKNSLEISASSVEFGEANERLVIDFPEEECTEIAFNARYLMEPLQALEDVEISFEIRDSFSPGVVRLGDSFLCVIMPLRTGSNS